MYGVINESCERMKASPAGRPAECENTFAYFCFSLYKYSRGNSKARALRTPVECLQMFGWYII